ncbi:Hypothetical predicted protein [Octopus vulgaris]|uniref:Uncharacterized protein n=1 Tax=Octopus vulgaris TaxID=6645 RepID=A0AA36BZ42_OCTVU|nr:Hypothetical predicted protein [Octopus vulgaris]
MYDSESIDISQNGARPHCGGLNVRKWLNIKFQRRCIGRRGAMELPPLAPHRTPPNFILWGVSKNIFYSLKPKTIVELKQRFAYNEHH